MTLTPPEIDDALFMARVDITPTCWLWMGHRHPRTGHGSFCPRDHSAGRTVPAYRWAYERFVGVIPRGLFIDHTCNNPPCVNPDHLEPVTNAENKRRAAERRLHCRRGHEYTPKNTYVNPTTGKRVCRTCHGRRS